MWATLLGLPTLISQALGTATAYFNRKLDIDLEKYKVNGQIDEVRLKAAMESMAAEREYLGSRAMRYVFVYPLGFWWIALIINQLVRDFLPFTWNVHTVPILDNWGGIIIAYLFLRASLVSPRS